MLSVGDMLRQERERKGLSLKQVEKEIKVREKFLAALENNNWNFFTSRIYVTGILKTYTQYLGLDTQKIIAFFRRDYERGEDEHFKRRISSEHLVPHSRRVMGIGIAIITLLFLAYFTYQLFAFLSPPAVSLLSPTTTTFRGVDKVSVTGKTEKEASITVFGEKIFPNKEGVFQYEFPLREGSNELVIEVVGANGKKTVFKKIFIRE